MNSTLKALLARGIDSTKATFLVKEKYTIKSLSTLGSEQLKKIGLTEVEINSIFKKRPPIPNEIVTSLLQKSRSTCCVCRDSKQPIIIHHINEWNTSKSHNEENLVVLCLNHHDEAHTKKELSLNLTPQRIRASKKDWEEKVKKYDKELFLTEFKEFSVCSFKLAQLKKRWFNFLQNLKVKVELIEEPFDALKYDFKIIGKKTFFVKVFEINRIEDLIDRELFIKEYIENSCVDNTIILGNKPFLSEDGYYSGEVNIQIGWIYSYGEEDWDNIMLKAGFDMSNSKFYVEDFLYEHTYWKGFLTDNDFEEISSIWKESKPTP